MGVHPTEEASLLWNWPTSDLPRASLFEPESYFLLGPVGTLRGDARAAPPCPTTLCVWRRLPYLTLVHSSKAGGGRAASIEGDGRRT